MSDDDDMEKRLAKSGAELFKELLRVYDVAEFEDYMKNGQWQDELMRVDLQLVEAHRREAGAGEPVPLSEVKMPVVPFMPGGGGVRPPAGLVGSPVVGSPVQAASGVGAVAELRLIALFVAKWKLDATRTKEKLGKLLPARRRFVIANFKTTETGPAATDALDKYIEECEKNNTWPAATAVAPKPVAVATAYPAAVKRPLVVAAAFDPNKRPRMVSPPVPMRPVTASPAAAALAARLAAQRPRTVSPAVRPVAVSAAVRPAWGPRPVAPRPVAPAVRPTYARLGVNAVAARPAFRPVSVPVRPVRPGW
eukprot:TRINITY_DN42814_c0_g1_i1.p1 TRINITY_DN42814_c0_g1~~TRINITY_DN42814_c0_g1_i1.p1  ORF type:complete len:308 (-),score=41.94 TRINITY_DN42814_c0_g1_i1:100-1023(-)